MAGIEPRFETFAGTFADALQRVWSENIQRRHLTSTQRAAIIVTQEELVARIEVDARERQLSKLKQYQEKNTVTQLIRKREEVDGSASIIIDEPKPQKHVKESDAILAKTADTNRQYVSDAKKIKKESPKVFDMVKSGNISIENAKNITKLAPETQSKVIEDIKASQTHTHSQSFRVIV